MLSQRRAVNLAGGLAGIAMLAYAFYSQYHDALEPCPLCMFQRFGVAAMTVVFLVAAAHHPRARGAYVYAALIALTALVTIGVAGKHVYIQHQPPGSVPACGAPLDVLLQMFSVSEVIAKVLRGGGECAVVNWTFLGLAMPAWVLICAVILGAAGVVANTRVAGRARSAG
jgi:disulfide bond formation protein DsbB